MKHETLTYGLKCDFYCQVWLFFLACAGFLHDHGRHDQAGQGNESEATKQAKHTKEKLGPGCSILVVGFMTAL